MASETLLLERAPTQAALKRALDFSGALLGLILCSPLFLAICLLLSLSDRPRKVFYRQTRLGREGRPFEMIKFRTMRPGADEGFQEFLDQNPTLRLEYAQYQKLARDPRLTRLGRILRRTSLDELPQLWNVLRGEMSLVGPRPFLPEQARMYGSGLALYTRFRPGLTGLWQVSGRNLLSFQERGECDLDYMLHWSLRLDLAILLRTPIVVLFQHGAY